MIRTIVFRALDNATENGYDMLSMPDAEIVQELGDYDSDCEGVDPALLLEAVQAWKESKR